MALPGFREAFRYLLIERIVELKKTENENA